ncbi:MAG: hypothetical protein AB1589_40690, partial [Cyanobacteriota bacterium]
WRLRGSGIRAIHLPHVAKRTRRGDSIRTINLCRFASLYKRITSPCFCIKVIYVGRGDSIRAINLCDLASLYKRILRPASALISN